MSLCYVPSNFGERQLSSLKKVKLNFLQCNEVKRSSSSTKPQSFGLKGEFIFLLSAINHLKTPLAEFVPHWSRPSSKCRQAGLNQQHVSWIKGRSQMWLMRI